MSEEARCHLCGAPNEDEATECENCGFPLHSRDLYHARIAPRLVPGRVAERVLRRLNEIRDADELRRSVPLLEPGLPDSEPLAERILRTREREHEGRFGDLEAVAAVPGLTAGRFGELVTDLGTEPHAFEPEMSTEAPGRQRFSASRSELDFTYELLTDVGGHRSGTVSHVRAARCTSCGSSVPAYIGDQERYEARVDVTKAIFDGEDDFATINVEMDNNLTPYDFMVPLSDRRQAFGFPALMSLNNNMVLHVRLKDGGEELTLVSGEVASQAGKIFAWPPYGMRLHTLGPSDYHVRGDDSKTPVLRVLDGTTFLTGPSNFLGHHADILGHEATVTKSNELRAVRLRWRPVPDDTRYERQADHYHVYRAVVEEPSSDEPSEAAWRRVSGPVRTAEWTDEDVPSGAATVYYRVVAVWVTSLDRAFEGFPGQSVRIEPPGSPFRPRLPLA